MQVWAEEKAEKPLAILKIGCVDYGWIGRSVQVCRHIWRNLSLHLLQVIISLNIKFKTAATLADNGLMQINILYANRFGSK